MASRGVCWPTESDDADIGGQMNIPTFAPAALGSVQTVLVDLHIASASERPECGDVGGPAVALVVLPCREREIKRLSKMRPVDVIEVYVRPGWPVLDGLTPRLIQPGKPPTPLKVADLKVADGGTKPQRRPAWYRWSPSASWEATASVQHPPRAWMSDAAPPERLVLPPRPCLSAHRAVCCLAGVRAGVVAAHEDLASGEGDELQAASTVLKKSTRASASLSGASSAA